MKCYKQSKCQCKKQLVNKLYYTNIKEYYVRNKGKEEKEDVPNECIFRIYYYNKLYNNIYIVIPFNLTHIYVYTHTHTTH